MKTRNLKYSVKLLDGNTRLVEGQSFIEKPGLAFRKDGKEFLVETPEDGLIVAVFARKNNAVEFINDVWDLLDWRKEPLKTLKQRNEVAHYIYNRSFGFEVEKPKAIELSFGQAGLF